MPSPRGPQPDTTTTSLNWMLPVGICNTAEAAECNIHIATYAHIGTHTYTHTHAGKHIDTHTRAHTHTHTSY